LSLQSNVPPSQGGSLVPQPLHPLALYAQQSQAAADPDESLHLRDLIRIIFKRKWWILAATVIGLTYVTIRTLMETPLYQATTTLQIDRASQRIVDYKDARGTVEDSYDDGSFLQTQLELIRSRQIAERVMEALNLDVDRSGQPKAVEPAAPPDAEKKEVRSDWIGRIMTTLRKRSEPSVNDQELLSREAVLGGLLGSTQVVPVPNTKLIRIGVIGADPVLAAKMANAWADAYIASNLDRKVDASSYARKFLDQELAKAKARLEESENALIAYTKQKQILNVEEKGNPVSQNYAEFSSALANAERERIKAEANYDEAKRTSSSTKELLENKAISTFKENKAKLELEYQDLLRTYKPTHPRMIAMDAQIANAEKRIQEEAKTISSTVEITARAALDSAKAQEERLRARVEVSKRSLFDAQDQGIRYGILKREVDTNRDLFGSLLQRSKELGITSQSNTNNVAIVDKAQIPLFPFRPDVMRGVMTGLLLGLMAGLALAFVIEYMDDSIKFPDEVERFTGLPLIGVIPRVTTTKLTASQQATEDPRSALAEAYRSVRTALQFSTAKGAPRTIVVTSCTKNEGKSTSAFALAVALSQMGKRVLLVDADMRNPTMHRMLDMDHSEGLSNVLSSPIDPISVTRRTKFANLYVITGGPIPPNPAELLSGENLKKIIDPAMTNFDHVIFDGPPILGIADSIILCNQVEASIFVVESSKTRKAAIRNAVRRLRQAGRVPVGAILTKLGSELTMYGYEQQFYYYGDKPELSKTT
jgi:polysaccharide biosynthesis transport protein